MSRCLERTLLAAMTMVVVMTAAADDNFGVGEAPMLIPLPSYMIAQAGAFSLQKDSRIEFVSAQSEQWPQVERVSSSFRSLLEQSPGIALAPATRAGGEPLNRSIRFELLAVEGGPGEEGYSLRISPQRIVVRAHHPRGLLYGAVTLWQLITAAPNANGALKLAALEIDDAPRFKWRGLMLDVARHYVPPQFIKRLLDEMALHKLNTFHWHLTDDQGWRLQIRKYPRLTQIGAWRTPAGAAGRNADGSPVRYGGFYTQDDVRDIVRYAAERHIMVVPEIEMPGHAQAAIAAYPRLGVDGSKPRVSADWGVHTYLFNVEESTFSFLEDVLTEVIELFPGTYVHVGGDEAAKDRWIASPRIQARMRELGVASEVQLQSYFIRRIEEFLSAHGRKLIGWDEILEGGIAPNATVMSWRGSEGGIEAAHQGHDVVMAPAPVLYMDHLQSDDVDEPPGRPALVTLADVYGFEPVPAQITSSDAHHVLGAQVNMWTEHMRTLERIEHALFPRLAAIAEVTWSPAASRDFPSFERRLQAQLARYEARGIRYAKNALQPNATAERLRGAEPLVRRDEELKTCNSKLPLHLEDDAPSQGKRAIFLVDIMDPCWIFERAPPAKRISVTVGQLPYNFQLWRDAKNVVVRPANTPAGELVVRRGTCDGPVVASLSLAPATGRDALTTLQGSMSAEGAPASGPEDLCLTFGTGKIDPLWVIDRVELITN